jgi:hypothetical protein
MISNDSGVGPCTFIPRHLPINLNFLLIVLKVAITIGETLDSITK